MIGKRLSLAMVCVAVVGGVFAASAAGLLPSMPGPQVSPPPKAPARTVTVTRRTLQTRAALSGTLGYTGSIDLGGGLTGTLTWAPAPGTVIRRGGELYEVDGRKKAILMYGARPEWRAIGQGVADGPDIEQLEENLKALGYASERLTVDRHWDYWTTVAVIAWQRAAGIDVDWEVNLGEVVFLPQAFRVATSVPLGSAAGGTVLHGTSDQRVVLVSLPADRRSMLEKDANVTVSLPDGTVQPGRVSDVGRVAHADQAGPAVGSTPTIDVTIALDDPSSAGYLDQAPVNVQIVTGSRPNALALPVNALVALLEGGYAVELVAGDGSTRYVRVELGMFDAGWVELTGGDIHEGDRVVVP